MTKPTYSSEAGVVFWLHQAHHALRTDILRVFQEKGHDLTTEQYAILTALWQRGDCSQAALARASGRDRPGVTRLVDALEKKKLVARADAPGDRRSYRVRLTAAGRKLHGLLGTVVEEVVAHALRGLPAKDRETLRTALKHVAQRIRGG